MTKIAGSRSGSVSRGTDMRIRIRTKMSRICNTASLCVVPQHRSPPSPELLQDKLQSRRNKAPIFCTIRPCSAVTISDDQITCCESHAASKELETALKLRWNCCFQCCGSASCWSRSESGSDFLFNCDPDSDPTQILHMSENQEQKFSLLFIAVPVYIVLSHHLQKVPQFSLFWRVEMMPIGPDQAPQHWTASSRTASKSEIDSKIEWPVVSSPLTGSFWGSWYIFLTPLFTHKITSHFFTEETLGCLP